MTIREKRPTLKHLRNFAKRYYKGNPPKIVWKRIDALGQRIRNKNLIYINPKVPLDSVGCMLAWDHSYFPQTDLKLISGEQYFLTLLHEIGHFKIKLKAPNEFYRLKNKAIRALKEELEIAKQFKMPSGIRNLERYRSEKAWLRANIDPIMIFADIKRRQNETLAEYEGRIDQFGSWLLGDYINEHIKVEDWAISELKKNREEIQKILGYLK